MKVSEAELNIESRPARVVELHNIRKMPEVDSIDCARDGVEEKLTTEPLRESEQDKRVADLQTEV